MLCCMKKTIFMLLMLVTVPLSAAVYKWVDGSGQVHYGDQPSAGATEVELPEAMVYTPPDYTDDDEPASGDSEAVAGGPYKSLVVVQPANDETLRSNEGNVAVSIELIPGLVENHKFVIYLDGNRVSGELTTSQITLQNVDRGSHSLEIAVVDANGQEVLRSTAVSFHLRRFSQLLPEPPKPENPIEPPPGDDDDAGDDDGPTPENPIAPPPGDDDDDSAGDDDDGDTGGDDDGDTGGDDDGNGGNRPNPPSQQNPYAPNYRPKYSPRTYQP